MTATKAEQIRFPHADRRLSGVFSGILFLMLATVYAACDFGPGVDERAPAVQILRPGNEAGVAGSDVLIRVSAEARGDDNFISYININLDSRLIGEATLVEGSDPAVYALRWNSFDAADGTHRLEAVAFDRNQSRGVSAPVTIRVNNTTTGEGPATTIAQPSDGQEVTGTVRVIAQRQEGEPDITRLEFLIDGVVVSSVERAPYEFEWNTANESPGTHVIQVRAFSAPTVSKFSDPVITQIAPQDDDTTGNNTPGNVKADFVATGFHGDVKGSVAVGFNNDLYIGTLTDTLYAFSPQGRLKWKFGTGGPIRSTPVVGNNEDVFVTSEDGRLYGLRSSGSQLWPAYNTNALVRSTPTLGPDGYLFFGDTEGRVHAVNTLNGLAPDGWPRKVSNASIVTPPVITENFTIIVAATDGYVYALRRDGSLDWRSPNNIGSINVGLALADRLFTLPLPNGETSTTKATVIYAVSNDGYLYALSGDDGTLLWNYPLDGPLRSGPIVGPDGAVYVGTSSGLVILNEDANQSTPRLRYRYPASDVGTPVIDANENIFFVSGKELKAIHPNNTPYWTGSVDLRGQADGPLTIARDGRVYVACNNGILYGIPTGSVGLAQQKWPMFQRNARHTGRLGTDATDG